MRYPEGHKRAVRERIIKAAARALRQAGLEGVSIPALMKRAGLTHGGFYAHFKDRDELVAEAVTFAAQHTEAKVLRSEASLDATLATYLSLQHVGHPAEGCVLAALGTDAARAPRPVRKAFAHAARGFIEAVGEKLETSEPFSDDALALAAQMVGAVVLARLVDDPSLQVRLLEAARHREDHPSRSA